MFAQAGGSSEQLKSNPHQTRNTLRMNAFPFEMESNRGVGIVNSIGWPTTTIWFSVVFFQFFSYLAFHWSHKSGQPTRESWNFCSGHPMLRKYASARKNQNTYLNSAFVAKRIAYMVKTSWSQAMNLLSAASVSAWMATRQLCFNARMAACQFMEI